MSGFDIVYGGLVGIGLFFMFKPILKHMFSSPMTIEKFLSKPCPKGVKSPIYELCQRMVKDTDFVQLHPDAFSIRCSSTTPWGDSYGIRYEVGRLKNDPLTGEHLLSICRITLPGGKAENIELSIQEARYFNLAYSLRESIIDKEIDKRRAIDEQTTKEKEQKLRDEVTKLYTGEVK
jgi:hypothetical protein